MNIETILGYGSTMLFALEGTKLYLNNSNQTNIILAIFYGILTAVGGGTLRDIMLQIPIFWIKQPIWILISFVFSIISYYI